MEKFLFKTDGATTKQILKYLNQIAHNPKSMGKPLSANLKGLWRYRIGDYQIICDLKENELLIYALKINHRSKIYKYL
ncbi:MAG: mRNA interferase RelE/StbE [Rickettsiales bacterium]